MEEFIAYNDLRGLVPCNISSAQTYEYKWFREAMNYIIENGVTEIPRQKGSRDSPYALIHPMLAFYILIHFRFNESGYLLYNLLQDAGINPLDYLMQNIEKLDGDTEKDTSAYVYMMKNEVTGLTKVGMTSNPKRRLKDLDTGNGVRLSYVFCKFLPHASLLENTIHATYKHKRQSGEWFEFDTSDIQSIELLVDEWHDKHSLANSTSNQNKFCHRICEHCGRQFGIYYSDIIRGKGMFCGNACAATHRKTQKTQRVCRLCNATFKTIIPSKEFCSTECEYAYTRIDPTYKVNLETKGSIHTAKNIGHRVCQMCKKVITLTGAEVANGQGVFCSKRCSQLARAPKRFRKVCQNCGNSFETTIESMEHCTLECEIIAKQGIAPSYTLSSEIDNIVKEYAPFIINDISIDKLLPKMRVKTCEGCGEVFRLDEYEIRRGGGLFCKKECAFSNIHTHTYSSVCKNCGTIFKTLNPDNHYCCNDCEIQHSNVLLDSISSKIL